MRGSQLSLTPEMFRKVSWRYIAVTLIIGVNERYRLWLLKNSVFVKTVEIWGIENV